MRVRSGLRAHVLDQALEGAVGAGAVLATAEPLIIREVFAAEAGGDQHCTAARRNVREAAAVGRGVAREPVHRHQDRGAGSCVARDIPTYGLETAFVYRSFSIQGEYLRTTLFRKGRNLDYQGGYIYGSFFPTGESRPYGVGWGNFRWVKPKRKFGAVELAARWSFLDLNDRGFRGGEEKNVTLGLNWYLNEHVRLMFNTVFADVDLRRTLENDHPELYQGRLQIVF